MEMPFFHINPPIIRIFSTTICLHYRTIWESDYLNVHPHKSRQAHLISIMVNNIVLQLIQAQNTTCFFSFFCLIFLKLKWSATRSVVSWLFATPRTIACQAPQSTGFSRQEYWSGLPCPPPGDLPDPGLEPASLASPALAGVIFTTVLPGKPN